MNNCERCGKKFYKKFDFHTCTPCDSYRKGMLEGMNMVMGILEEHDTIDNDYPVAGILPKVEALIKKYSTGTK